MDKLEFLSRMPFNFCVKSTANCRLVVCCSSLMNDDDYENIQNERKVKLQKKY